MKRPFAIFFLFTFLLTNTELHQLLRLPVLLAHYQEHRVLNSEMGFIDYIVLHYSSDEADTDFGRDQQLPFKGQHACTEILWTTADIPKNIVDLLTKKIEDSENYTFGYSDLFTSPYLLSIWQPPRA